MSCPAQSEPAQSEPAQSEPAQSEPAQSEPAQSEPTVQADAWTVGERRWDLYFGVVFAATLGITLVAGPGREIDRLLGGAALLAMVPWYLLAGRRAMYGDHELAWCGTIYLAGLVPLLVIAQSLAGSNTFILLALCPQCFMIVPFRRAVTAVVVLSLTQPLVGLAQQQPAAEVESLAGIAVAGIAFSVAFGTWIMRIISQSTERAELIAQLERTRTELAQVSREAGVLAERDRLASEIHDTIAQGFSSIVMLVQAADSLLESDPAQARRQLGLIGRTARENLAEARALVAGLAPAALSSATLADALARLTEGIGQELGIETSFSLKGPPRPLHTSTEVVLLRVCQEALSNVRKHAKADAVHVVLSLGDAEARLEVRDNGIGFDPGLADTGLADTGLADTGLAARGYGLRGMRARVADAGGTLEVTSALGEGTAVSVEVP